MITIQHTITLILLLASICISATTSSDTIPVSGNRVSTTVTDIDGNVYEPVIIGTQEWLTTDLRTTRCNDGTLIPLVTDNVAWEALSTAGYSWYNNDEATQTANGYGALYNWYAVNECNICPEGWHVPSDAEWTVLIDYLGGENVAGGKMKETGLVHWNSPNTGATNESGWSGLPGGGRDPSAFFSLGNFGYWWSATESDGDAWYRRLYYNIGVAYRFDNDKRLGFSVRCLRDTASPIDTDNDGTDNDLDPDDDNDGIPDANDLAPLVPYICGDFDLDGCEDCALGVDGFGPLPDNQPNNDGPDNDGDGICDSSDTDDDNDGIPDVKDATPFEPNTNTVTDGDGNIYESVTIGTQEWLTTDLRTTKCNDGTPIPLVTDNAAWDALSTAGYSWWGNDEATQVGNGYGALYNWYAVNECNICPAGWHVPTDGEWTILIDYLDPGDVDPNVQGTQSGVAGGKMKEAGLVHWISPNAGATNESGWSGLPGGFRDAGGPFINLGGNGSWWSATESGDNASYRRLSYNIDNALRYDYYKRLGFSVRCLRD